MVQIIHIIFTIVQMLQIKQSVNITEQSIYNVPIIKNRELMLMQDFALKIFELQDV